MNVAELIPDVDVLPPLAPVWRKENADRCAEGNAKNEVGVHLPDRRMLTDERFSSTDFSVGFRMLRNIQRLPPIHDEQRREHTLPIRILPRPVLAPHAFGELQPLGMGHGAGEQQRAEQQEEFHDFLRIRASISRRNSTNSDRRFAIQRLMLRYRAGIMPRKRSMESNAPFSNTDA